jgi:hypothetical protein
VAKKMGGRLSNPDERNITAGDAKNGLTANAEVSITKFLQRFYQFKTFITSHW